MPAPGEKGLLIGFIIILPQVTKVIVLIDNIDKLNIIFSLDHISPNTEWTHPLPSSRLSIVPLS